MDCSPPGFPVLQCLPEFAKLMSFESVMLSSHLILCHPILLLPSILPSIRVFSNESTLCMRWPKYWVSALASFLPKNTQDQSPLEWTGWISLQSKGLSRVFSNTTAQKNQFFGTQLASHPYMTTLTSIHDHWKNQSLDYMDLYWQSNVSAFEYAI